MKELKGTEDFLRINQKVNIFDIVSCKEEQASQIISWLLNPREAHNFGDKFFEAMLNELKDKNIKIFNGTKEVNEEDKISLIRDCQKKYYNIIIQNEYCIDGKCKNENGRIDILLCLEDPKILFVIENKYGAKEHNHQTTAYYKYFSDKYKDYNVCYIYLDIKGYYEDGESKLKDDKHWNIINYDWIVDFLRENLTGSYVDKILQDIYIEFTGNYEEEPYFKKFYNEKLSLAKKYEDDLSDYTDPYPYIPNKIKNFNLNFALYSDFYNCLSEYSKWDIISEYYKKYVIDDYSQYNRLAFTLQEVDEAYQKNNKQRWPFYINLSLHSSKNEENKKTQYLEVKLICTNEYIDKSNEINIPKKLKEIFDDKKIKNKIGKKIKSIDSTNKISYISLGKDTIEDFDFSPKKQKELYKKVEKYTKKLNQMYEIFFS